MQPLSMVPLEGGCAHLQLIKLNSSHHSRDTPTPLRTLLLLTTSCPQNVVYVCVAYSGHAPTSRQLLLTRQPNSELAG